MKDFPLKHPWGGFLFARFPASITQTDMHKILTRRTRQAASPKCMSRAKQMGRDNPCDCPYVPHESDTSLSPLACPYGFSFWGFFFLQ